MEYIYISVDPIIQSIPHHDFLDSVATNTETTEPMVHIG
jgi:hypothetical protein